MIAPWTMIRPDLEARVLFGVVRAKDFELANGLDVDVESGE